MPTSLTNLFNFGRPLPEPFDKLGSKKIKGVASQYGGTDATLCAAVIKAVHALCVCQNGGEGAVGQITSAMSVAEYKSSLSPEAYHLVVYDAATGNFLASVYDSNTELIEQYTVNASARDGAALFFSMIPQLMEDKEFQGNFQIYLEQYRDSFSDFSKAAHAMAILCDNVYRRVKDGTCAAHLKANVDKSGNLMRVSRAQLDSGLYQPTEVLAGEFTIFTQNGKPVVHKPVKVIDHKDFVGKYVLDPSRKLNAMEQTLVPTLPEWYVIPQEAVDICKHAQLTTGKPTQMRNFLLRGPAGTGKTMGAKAIAAGLGLPYMKYTCSAGTEIFDFVGMVFPNTEHSTGDGQLDQEREQLQAMGGVNYANVSKLLHLPDLDDMDYGSVPGSNWSGKPSCHPAGLHGTGVGEGHRKGAPAQRFRGRGNFQPNLHLCGDGFHQGAEEWLLGGNTRTLHHFAARRIGGPQLPAGAERHHHFAHRRGDPPPPGRGRGGHYQRQL